MFGQFRVEVEELELFELEPEPDELPELDDPEPVPLLEPEFVLLEPDDGVVVEELVLEPVVPELDEVVVAASATNAPPVTRPAVSAPIANTFRSRIFMVNLLSPRVRRHPVRSGRTTLRRGPVTGRTTGAEWRWPSLKIG